MGIRQFALFVNLDKIKLQLSEKILKNIFLRFSYVLISVTQLQAMKLRMENVSKCNWYNEGTKIAWWLFAHLCESVQRIVY